MVRLTAWIPEMLPLTETLPALRELASYALMAVMPIFVPRLTSTEFGNGYWRRIDGVLAAKSDTPNNNMSADHKAIRCNELRISEEISVLLTGAKKWRANEGRNRGLTIYRISPILIINPGRYRTPY